MSLVEIDRVAIVNLKNLLAVAFPRETGNSTLTDDVSINPVEDVEPQRPQRPRSVDLKQKPTQLVTRIHRLNILELAKIDQTDPILGDHFTRGGELFRENLKCLLLTEKDPTGENVRAIDLLRAYGTIISRLVDHREFANFHPLLRNSEVLEKYLLSLGVALINKDGSVIYQKIIKPLPEYTIKAKIVTQPTLRSRLQFYFSWLRRKKD